MKSHIYITLVCLFVFDLGTAKARIINVPTDFDAIKPAIAAAADGDVIVLNPGVYTGEKNMDISFAGKKITLRSTDPSDPGIVETTVLDGERSHSILSLTNGEDLNAKVLGLTLRRALGAIVLNGSSPVIAQCLFEYNLGKGSDSGWSAVYGGAIRCVLANPRIENCRFHSNVARPSGWGSGGGAIQCSSSNPDIISCTFWGNGSNTGGAISITNNSEPLIINCILWNNASFAADHSQIHSDDTSLPSVHYTVVQNGSGNPWFSATCMEVDPLLTRDGHLLRNSPCIDAGTSVNSPITDGDGEARWDHPSAPNTGGPLEDYFDIGADEFTDTDDDGMPDWWERKYFGGIIAGEPGGDPDFDDLINAHEYHSGTSPNDPDCDGDAWNDGFEVSRSIDPTGTNVFVDPSTGNDLYDGTTPIYLKGLHGPKQTIRSALTDAEDGQVVVLMPGTYTGNGNYDIDTSYGWGTLGAPVIEIQSENPLDENTVSTTVIDLDGQGRAFNFKYFLSPLTALRGITIQNGIADTGGAVLCYNSNITIENCIIRNNLSVDKGGAIYFDGDTFTRGASLYMKDSQVINCHAGNDGGAFSSYNTQTWLRISRSVISRCSAGSGNGHAIEAWGGDAEIDNSTIKGNFRDKAGSTIWVRDCAFSMSNCTLVDNSPDNKGTGIYFYTGPSGKIKNTILWQNGSREVSGQARLDYCCILDGWSDTGVNNISDEPRFVAPGRWVHIDDPDIDLPHDDSNAIWMSGDYHLLPDSPCIDSGDPDYVDSGRFDIDGDPRLIGNRIDIGVDEYHPGEL